MSMSRVVSWIVGKRCLLWLVTLDETMLPLPCFILYPKVKLTCFSRYHLSFYFCIPIPYDEEAIFFFFLVLVLEDIVSLHILQERKLECVALPFSRGSSQPRDQTQVSCIAGRILLLSEPPGKPIGLYRTGQLQLLQHWLCKINALQKPKNHV